MAWPRTRKPLLLLLLGVAVVAATAGCRSRLLGLLRAGDFTARTAAALLDLPAPDAEELLERLVEVHLLEVAGQEPTGRTRYRLHDLLRGFARERLLAETTEADRKLLLDRSGADLQQVATA